MKPFLLCLACLYAVSCTMQTTPPPGMPLDREHLPLTENSAITKVAR